MARLLFCFFLKTDTSYPLTLVGIEGDILRFREPTGSLVYLTVDPATHLPKRITFSRLIQATAPHMAGKSEKVSVELSDFRKIDSLQLPFRISETIVSEFRNFTSQIVFETIELNPKLTAEDFKN